MFEKIVVPLDGSELAEVVLPYAEELMRRLDSQLVLLSVCDSGEKRERMEYMGTVVTRLKRRAQRYRERFPEAIVREPEPEVALLEGKPSEGIIDYTEESGIDLTMMATHGRSGIGRWALGSVTDKVIRGLTRPICLIRARGHESEVHPDCLVGRILAPLDASPLGEAALPYVEALALKAGVEVLLFQVVQKAERTSDVNWSEIRKLEERNARMYLHRVQSNLANKGIVVRSDIEYGGNPTEQIIDVASRNRCAVVAMSTHGRSGM
ncbi:MAG: universal stress protein, partial [Chloroflexi bacterium]|nr:universal stress protein [Chloroflexota bacterium]